jgi:hypothetical protein
LPGERTRLGGTATSTALERDFSAQQVVGLPDGAVAFASSTAVLRVDTKGRLSLLAGSRKSGSSGDGGPATAARFHHISDLAVASDGALLIADGAGVRRVGPDGRVSTLLGPDTLGPCLASGLASAPTGALLIAEETCQRVLEVSPDGGVHTVAGTGTEGSTLADGPATAVDLHFPRYVAATPSGVVVADTRAMRRIDSDGVMRTLAVAPKPDLWQSVDVLADGSVLSTPALAIGTETQSLLSIDPAGRVTRVAGRAYVGFDGDGQWADEAPLEVLDIDVAPNGDVLLAEGFRVRRVATHASSATSVALTPETLRAPTGVVRAAFYVKSTRACPSRGAYHARRRGAR